MSQTPEHLIPRIIIEEPRYLYRIKVWRTTSGNLAYSVIV